MNVVIRTGVALAVAGLLYASPSFAQQTPSPQQPAEQERAKTPSPVSGELLSLNAETKTLTVKTTGDTEMKFSYTDATEILGADKGASGLATLSGASVTVHYEVHGTANTATKIEVTPKQQ